MIKLALALLLLMTGPMKLLVPELVLGLVLAVGIVACPAAVLVIGIMLAATYVHLVVDDPSLFPLQPSEPIIPLLVIVASANILWRGAGSWSRDLKATRRGTSRSS